LTAAGGGGVAGGFVISELLSKNEEELARLASLLFPILVVTPNSNFYMNYEDYNIERFFVLLCEAEQVDIKNICYYGM
jgi:hypothetical protein